MIVVLLYLVFYVAENKNIHTIIHPPCLSQELGFVCIYVRCFIVTYCKGFSYLFFAGQVFLSQVLMGIVGRWYGAI